MRIVYIKDIDGLQSYDYSEFVLQHSNGNVFQTPEMFRVFNDTKNYKPFSIIAYEDDAIVGVLQGVIQVEMKGLLSILSSRCIIWGGPICKPGTTKGADELLSTLNKYIRSKAIYTQFRNTFDTAKLKPTFLQNGYRYIEHLDIHINLDRPFDAISADFHKSRKRNVTKAINKGLVLIDTFSVNNVAIYYNLLKKTYDRVKMPLPDQTLFESAIKNFSEKKMLKVFMAEFDGVPIGIRLVLCYGGLLYDWYAGSEAEHNNKYTNDFLLVKILEWGANNNYNSFAFGGAGKPNKAYGVRDHKLKFGGELVSYGRYEKINKPLLMKVARLGFFVWRSIKK